VSELLLLVDQGKERKTSNALNVHHSKEPNNKILGVDQTSVTRTNLFKVMEHVVLADQTKSSVQVEEDARLSLHVVIESL